MDNDRTRPSAADLGYHRDAQTEAGAPLATPYNPYAQPASAGLASSAVQPPDGGPVAAGVIAELQGTKLWVRLLGIVAFSLTSIVVLAVIGLAISRLTQLSGPERARTLGAFLFYLLVALLMFYPARRMISYAAKIGRLVESRSAADLQAALSEQRKLWRFYGVFTLAYLALLAFGLLVVLLLPALAGGR